jgi:uncharacterized protein YdeI (BOF family)
MRTRCLIRLLAALWAGGVTGCHREGSQVLGVPPEGVPVSLAAARDAAGSGALTVTGTLVEKCPEAGCWFVLQDGTGKLKVDTKTAGFVVVEVPLHRVLTVTGHRVTNGTEVLLAATGLRY